MSVSLASAAPRLPVTMLTGFLGSGKTTLLAALLQRPEMALTAVIINEVGEIGLDHELLRIGSAEEGAVLLDGGCVCCSIRSDLADTLNELFLKRVKGKIPEFRRVVIETTGLADPAPILATLLTDPLTEARYRLDGVVATLDAVNADWQLDCYREAVAQAALADRLVLTKTDLVPPETTARLIERLAGINPAATPIPAVSGAIDPMALIGLDPARASPDLDAWLAVAPRHDHDHAGQDPHHHDDGVRSASLRLAPPLVWDRVAAALDDLATEAGDRLLRLKAILHIEGSEAPVVVHAIRHLFHPPALLDAWPSDDRSSRIVVITDGLDPAGLIEGLRQRVHGAG
jgi:G3E family GTPase